MKQKLKIFYTTISDKKKAKEFSENLLNNKEIICINVFNDISSFYSENNRVVKVQEVVLIIKTFLSKKKLKSIVYRYHPYEIPFLAQINSKLLSDKYYKWASK
tara:strand:+ start:206 stop:514 length:309 start_codon:yes stop_codon:yes gene_type:complete